VLGLGAPNRKFFGELRIGDEMPPVRGVRRVNHEVVSPVHSQVASTLVRIDAPDAMSGTGHSERNRFIQRS